MPLLRPFGSSGVSLTPIAFGAMRVTADKGACRLMAQRMWPALSDLFARVRDDGRAEAALLGFYGRAQWQKQEAQP